MNAEKGLPLAGQVAAGMTTLAFEQTERINFDELFGSPDLFVLKVAGDSMIEAQIDDGDYKNTPPHTHVSERLALIGGRFDHAILVEGDQGCTDR